ncbi:MAG: VWA domain-containing protein [Verrucomicrobia bacterium]|nr:VWA domain-containing protein [Verrucomicrobiota bacterium]
MNARVTSTANVWGRPSGRHVPAALAAVLLSLGMHFAAWQQHPVLPIGSLARVREKVRFPSIRLHDVQPVPWETVRRPARFRPEDPGRRTSLAEETADWVEQVRQALPPSPDLSRVPLAGEGRALTKPPAPPARARWEPRQEILQVEEKLYAEEISALPRRYAPHVPRAARAADITPPSTAELAALASSSAAVPVESSEPGAWLRQLPGPGRLSASEKGPPPGPSSLLVEESAVLDEKLPEVTELKPVEQMLAIEVGAWQPPDEPDAVYFELRIRREGEALLPVLPKDVLLIQDCSESMTQAKLNSCKDGLQRWIGQFDSKDRFDLLTFRDTSERLFDRWTEPTTVNRSIAVGYVDRLVARGKTDVYGSLEQVLTLDRDPARPVIAVLVTDGRPTMGMVDSSDIIEAFTRASAGSVSMFCVGGGIRVNRFLLDLLGYKNRGDALVVEDSARIPEAVQELARQISRPVLTDLTYRFSGIPEDDIFPRTLTHLYLDRPLVIYGRYPAGTPRVVFQVVGQARGQRADMVFEWNWSQLRPGDSSLRTRWVWQRIYHLIGEHVREARPEILDEIHALANRYGLMVPYGTDIPTR